MSGDSDSKDKKDAPALPKSDTPKHPNAKIPSAATPDTKLPPNSPTPGGSLDAGGAVPTGSLATDSGGLCLRKILPINFVFAMDVSGSMQPHGDVKDSFQELSQSLSTLAIPGLGVVPKVNFGLITFEDTVIDRAPLSSNFVEVKQKIEKTFVSIERWSDQEEGGLMAVDESIKIARASEGIAVISPCPLFEHTKRKEETTIHPVSQ